MLECTCTEKIHVNYYTLTVVDFFVTKTSLNIVCVSDYMIVIGTHTNTVHNCNTCTRITNNYLSCAHC